jgi:hypothetical protein
MEELPNCRHLSDDRPACGFPRELHPSAMDDLPCSSIDVLALTLRGSGAGTVERDRFPDGVVIQR